MIKRVCIIHVLSNNISTGFYFMYKFNLEITLCLLYLLGMAEMARTSNSNVLYQAWTKIPRLLTGAVNWSRTDNTMTKERGQNTTNGQQKNMQKTED
jgi:hypothetical protein